MKTVLLLLALCVIAYLFRRWLTSRSSSNPSGAWSLDRYAPLPTGGLVGLRGESHYRAAIQVAQRGGRSSPPDDLEADVEPDRNLRWVDVVLEREPRNRHDPNAIIVRCAAGPVGYLPAERAPSYGKVLGLLEERGFLGARCPAFVQGGDYLGVVVALAGSRECMAHIKADLVAAEL